MKLWIWLCVSGALSIEVLGNDSDEIFQRCLNEGIATEEELDDDFYVKAGDNRNVKCFKACIGKKAGWLTENGDILPDKLFNMPMSEIPTYLQPRINHMVQRCNRKRKDECETAYFVFKCLQAHMKKVNALMNLINQATSNQ